MELVDESRVEKGGASRSSRASRTIAAAAERSREKAGCEAIEAAQVDSFERHASQLLALALGSALLSNGLVALGVVGVTMRVANTGIGFFWFCIVLLLG